MIACADAVRQLWDYLDGIVEQPEVRLIEEHLAFCRRCCGELEFAEELRAFLAGHADDHLPEDVYARLTTTFERLEGR